VGEGDLRQRRVSASGPKGPLLRPGCRPLKKSRGPRMAFRHRPQKPGSSVPHSFHLEGRSVYLRGREWHPPPAPTGRCLVGTPPTLPGPSWAPLPLIPLPLPSLLLIYDFFLELYIYKGRGTITGSAPDGRPPQPGGMPPPPPPGGTPPKNQPLRETEASQSRLEASLELPAPPACPRSYSYNLNDFSHLACDTLSHPQSARFMPDSTWARTLSNPGVWSGGGEAGAAFRLRPYHQQPTRSTS